MANPVTMPQLGLTMQTGIVEQWLKKVGDYVEKGEPLVEVTGDKVTLQLESPYAGYLKKILVEAGTEVPVQKVLAYLGAEDAELWAEESAALQSATEALPASAAAAGDAQARVPAAARPGRVKASPVAKRLAAELGIDLATVLPTGPDGLISGDDVRAAHHAKDPAIPAANEIKL
jgi:pyruvate dehydrogenase E2 component (dihydrolipoamide acetyltransferase)